MKVANATFLTLQVISNLIYLTVIKILVLVRVHGAFFADDDD